MSKTTGIMTGLTFDRKIIQLQVIYNDFYQCLINHFIGTI